MTALGHYQPLSVSLGEWLESAKSGRWKSSANGRRQMKLSNVSSSHTSVGPEYTRPVGWKFTRKDPGKLTTFMHMTTEPFI